MTIKPKISIIIVNFKSDKELLHCLSAIEDSRAKAQYEIIVVDNNDTRSLKSAVSLFDKIRYIKNKTNIGYGASGNIGARCANGEFLFFLNPDTFFENNCIDILIDFLQKNNNISIVAPLLLDKNKKIYPLQGTGMLTPLSATFSLSFFNTIFPNNPISRKFWLLDWSKKNPKQVEVVPGTAFVIRKSVFDSIGGFDERFFLFFEESDLCKRVRDNGGAIWIVPSAKIVHLWGVSTARSEKDINKIFKQSRYYYFKKHFGLLSAIFVETVLSVNKRRVFLGLIFFTAVLIRFYKLDTLMMFIGDFGWFYMSAKDMIFTGNIPLVGITSSHTWLHQGPLWTYMLAFILFLFKFNPISGGYFAAFLGMVTTWWMYIYGTEMFGRRVGLFSFVLFAFSPLVIIHSRMPYHTAPIPLFTLFFVYSVYRWLSGSNIFFPVALFLLAILYNFELATVPLVTLIFLPMLLKILKRNFFLRFTHTKIVILSIVGFLIPMIPVLIYDIHNGFPQTVRFTAWIFYRILRVFGFPQVHPIVQPEPFSKMLEFSYVVIQRLVFLPNFYVAFFLLAFCATVFLQKVYKDMKGNRLRIAHSLLILWTGASVVGFFLGGTPSEAYIPVIFPAIIFIMAIGFDSFMKGYRRYAVGVLSIVLLVLGNTVSLVSQNYLMRVPNGYGFLFSERLHAAEKIVRESKGRGYNLLGKGPGSQYESFTKNYEYLTWYFGNKPSRKKQSLVFTIQETNKEIIVNRLGQ